MSTYNIEDDPVHRILSAQSCVGCGYLYLQDVGYSNYTVEGVEVRCALDKNSHLKSVEKPYDWNQDEYNDNWPLTADSRCGSYLAGKQIRFDVDNEYPSDTTPEENPVWDMVYKHAGREP